MRLSLLHSPAHGATRAGTVPTAPGLLLRPAVLGEVQHTYVVCASTCSHRCVRLRSGCSLRAKDVNVVRFFRELPPPSAGAWAPPSCRPHRLRL